MAGLSLIISNYNHARYLPECLDSVLSQSRIPDEILIVDDCSTDHSREILNDYARRHHSIRLYVNETNRGIVENINRLSLLANGDYLAALGADDKWLPDFVEKGMDMLHKFPQAALCCSYPAYLNDRSGEILENRSPWASERRFFSPSELADVIRIYEGCLFGHACIMKKDTFLEAGGFYRDVEWHSDWLNLLVQGFRHGVCFIPEALAALRIKSDSYSARGMHDWRLQRETLRNVLTRLASDEWADVAEFFANSGVLSTRGDAIVVVTAVYDDLRTEKTLKLIETPGLKYSGLRALGRVMNKWFRVPESTVRTFQDSLLKGLWKKRWLWKLFWMTEYGLRGFVRGLMRKDISVS